MPDLQEQELNAALFRRVRTHLLTQMERSADGGEGGCLYRGPDGLQCAVGCLIDDTYFDDEFNSARTDDHQVVTAVADSLGLDDLDGITVGLLMDLQNVHDTVSPELWESKLNSLWEELKSVEIVPAEAEIDAPR